MRKHPFNLGPHRGQGESLVPLYTRESVSLSLNLGPPNHRHATHFAWPSALLIEFLPHDNCVNSVRKRSARDFQRTRFEVQRTKTQGDDRFQRCKKYPDQRRPTTESIRSSSTDQRPPIIRDHACLYVVGRLTFIVSDPRIRRTQIQIPHSVAIRM
jgi:hypothetical protein